MEICEKTLTESLSEEEIEKTKEKMLAAFSAIADWITGKELAEKCGKDWENIGSRDIVKLRNLYNAIKDGFVKPHDAFGKDDPSVVKPGQESADRLNKLNGMLGGDQNGANG